MRCNLLHSIYGGNHQQRHCVSVFQWLHDRSMDHGCYKRMRHGSISRAASPPARVKTEEGAGTRPLRVIASSRASASVARGCSCSHKLSGPKHSLGLIATVQVSLVFVVGGPGAGSHWIASVTHVHASCTTTLEA